MEIKAEGRKRTKSILSAEVLLAHTESERQREGGREAAVPPPNWQHV